MNTLVAARTLKRILGFLIAKLALRSSGFLFKILNKSFTLDLPLLVDKQAECVNILLFSCLNARLNEQSLFISTLADGTKVGLTLFLDSLADVFASLALAFHLLAKFVHSHSAFPTCFYWVVNLVVIAETS